MSPVRSSSDTVDLARIPRTGTDVRSRTQDLNSHLLLSRQCHVPDDLPVVDFESEIVAVFLELRGFPPACDWVFFDGVDFGDADVSGRPRNVDPVGLQECLAIGISRSFVVAIERNRLPKGPFLLRRDVEPWSYDVEREQVMVDLD